mgnify:CR=1 FL=1|jgi:ribosome-associated translation inhibitor RaiA
MTPFKSHTNAQPENDNSVSQNETNKQTAEFSVGENISPEISSYVFQSLQELEPYTTHNTQVAVIAKDPAKLASRYRAEGIEFDSNKLKKMHRISITLSEDGAKLEQEAVHENLIDAIRMAKEQMIKVLQGIQDQVITSQDRAMQINAALNGQILQ